MSKPKEWFAVKRSKNSSYQFYEPNPKNRKSIEAIAPDKGNFEEICLVEKSAYDELLEAFNQIFEDYQDIGRELAKECDKSDRLKKQLKRKKK